MKTKYFNVKIIISACIVISAVFAVTAILQNEDISAQEFENQPKVPRAVIIDQISDEIPNERFQQKAITIFEDAGYTVDLVESQDVTVDFYKKLPSMNYDYVVLRSHAVPQENSDTPVVLFTGETYSTDRYITEQLLGHVMRAAPVGFSEFEGEVPEGSWVVVNSTYQYYEQSVKHVTYAKSEYFAVSPKLVDEMMVGEFPASTILLGGCGTLSNPSLAESLLKRGASEVVGWNESIGSNTNDQALLAILEDTVTNKMGIEDSLESQNKKYSNISKWSANLMSLSQEDL